MPYKTAVEYWTKLPAPGANNKDVIAVLEANEIAPNSILASVALFSVVPSADIDLNIVALA